MNTKKNKKIPQPQTEPKKLKEELETYKKQYLRALADYHNLENRINEERERIGKRATKAFVLKLLPFLDNLEKAEVFVKDEGLGLIKNQFSKILKDEGLEEIQILGGQFNPELAEAVDVVKGEDDNIVQDVLQKGYMLDGEVVRHAQVKVTKKDL